MKYSILTRSYDLRWVYPTEINEWLYEAYWYGFVRYTESQTIALGYDARLSSPTLKEAIIRWANNAGAKVVDIWLCSSDMLSFSTCFYDDIDAGIMITASHNPKDQNGIKSMRHNGFPINLKNEWNDILVYMDEYDTMNHASQRNVEVRDVKNDWTDRILSFSETKNFSSLKIVVDGGNWAAGSYIEAIAEKAWFQMIPLFIEPDGNFPNHHPNPMLPENREAARKKIIETGADIGLLFDGDADRVVVLDNRWNLVVSWVLCAVIAAALLEKSWGKSIGGNAVISHTLEDIVTELWGQYKRMRVDSVAIKTEMLKNPDIIFAWEHSTHYFFWSNWCTDSGIIASFVFLDIFLRSGLTLEALIAKYQRYITLEEENFIVADRNMAINTLRSIYSWENYDDFDGLTVRYDDKSWWNVRPASNDPVIRLNMEAVSRDRFNALYKEVTKHLKQFK